MKYPTYISRKWLVCTESVKGFKKGEAYCFYSNGTVISQDEPLYENLFLDKKNADKFREWTIFDATPGTVLSNASGSIITVFWKIPASGKTFKGYFYMKCDEYGKFIINETINKPSASFYPATYKQIRMLHAVLAYQSKYVWNKTTNELDEKIYDSNIEEMVRNYMDANMERILDIAAKAYRQGLIDAFSSAGVTTVSQKSGAVNNTMSNLKYYSNPNTIHDTPAPRKIPEKFDLFSPDFGKDVVAENKDVQDYKGFNLYDML